MPCLCCAVVSIWLRTPSRSSSGRLCGSNDSPMWKRGCLSFSMSTTRRPRSARRAATLDPAGPPPMTRTSQSGTGGEAPGCCISSTRRTPYLANPQQNLTRMRYPTMVGPTTISHRFAVMSNTEESPDAARSQALVDGYYADPGRPPSFVRDMFNRSAQHYDLVNQLFSLGSGAWYRRFCLRRAGVGPGMFVVDVATGTGLLAREAIALAGDRTAVIGVDVSEAMLAIAQRNLSIPVIQATAEALPLLPGIADF